MSLRRINTNYVEVFNQIKLFEIHITFMSNQPHIQKHKDTIMTINVNATLKTHINSAFRQHGDIAGIDLLRTIIDEEFERVRIAVKQTLDRDFEIAKHQVAYRLILEELLAHHDLTDVVATISRINLDSKNPEVLTNNLMHLAQMVTVDQNVWSIFRKEEKLTDKVYKVLNTNVLPNAANMQPQQNGEPVAQ